MERRESRFITISHEGAFGLLSEGKAPRLIFKPLRDKSYYGPAYTWSGECPACGAASEEHVTVLFKAGFAEICNICGDWECHHERGVQRFSHRSTGVWTTLRGKATLPDSVRRCPGPPLDDLGLPTGQVSMRPQRG